MQPEVLPLFYRDTDETLCHMFYKNWLVLNLEANAVNDCVALVNKGVPRWLNYEMPFLLDADFTVHFETESGNLVLADSGKTFCETGYDKTYVNEWLVEHLQAYGYEIADYPELAAADMSAPEIFEVGSQQDYFGKYDKLFYLFYQNYLVLDLLEKNISACVELLDGNQPIGAQMGLCFDLNDKFVLRVEKLSRSLYLADGTKHVRLNYFDEMLSQEHSLPLIKKWFSENLFKRGFIPQLCPAASFNLRQAKYLMFWVIVITLIVAASFGKATVATGGTGNILFVFVIIVVFLLAGLFMYLKWKSQGSPELAFAKNQS